MIKDYALGNCRNLRFFTAPDIIFMRFQIYQQIRYEHLLLRYDEIYTMSDKTPYIIGRHCTQYKYYRALGFSLNQFFLFPHLPRSICRTVCTIQKNYVMPQQVSRTKCITGSNIGWECMQDILSTGLMSALKSSNSAMYRLVTSIKSSILHIIIYV